MTLSSLEHSKRNYLDPRQYKLPETSATIAATEGRRSCSVGPAAYNVDEAYRALNKKTVVHSMRPIQRQTYKPFYPEPGPQTYKVQRRQPSGGYMSLTPSARYDTRFRTPEWVGPGSYDIEEVEANQRRGKGFTFKGR